MSGLNNLYLKADEALRVHCLRTQQRALDYGDFSELIKALSIDIKHQYTENDVEGEYLTNKVINQHAFQTFFTRDAILSLLRAEKISSEKLALVDIGDSAGNHLKYQKELLKDYFNDIQAVSVNLDPVAVDKIRKNGGVAVLSRAEDYRPDDMEVSCYLSYEMIEHLHNPALFFHRLALADNGKYLIMTVPYVKNSRVSLEYVYSKEDKPVYAEGVHVFELSPEDWIKIALHSGWETIHKEIYYQYPRHSVLTPLYRHIWRGFDYEGFLGLVLERNMIQAERYKDWED